MTHEYECTTVAMQGSELEWKERETKRSNDVLRYLF